MPYFSYFPKINYFDKETRNIINKAAIISDVLNRADGFFPYIIKDYERPDIIAYQEYNDETLDWVVFFSNGIVDPYYDWPLFPESFKLYLEKKYNKTIYELQSQISHYKYTGLTNETQEEIDRTSWIMSTTTHALIGDTSGWSPVYVYDYEVELNDAKRSIKLLNKTYIPQLRRELKQIFSA